LSGTSNSQANIALEVISHGPHAPSTQLPKKDTSDEAESPFRVTQQPHSAHPPVVQCRNVCPVVQCRNEFCSKSMSYMLRQNMQQHTVICCTCLHMCGPAKTGAAARHEVRHLCVLSPHTNVTHATAKCPAYHTTKQCSRLACYQQGSSSCNTQFCSTLLN
jgi:hypothetical protein